MRELYYQASAPIPPLTMAALNTAGALEARGLTKAYWAHGEAVGFSIEPDGFMDYANRLDGAGGITPVPPDYAGHLYMDPENDNDAADHDHDWRYTRWQDLTPENSLAAHRDVCAMLAWTKILRPFATVGLFQFFDLPLDFHAEITTRLQFLADGSDVLEPGGYHLWRNGSPDLDRDMVQIQRRIDTANTLKRRTGQKVRCWSWFRFQGGGVMTLETYEAYMTRLCDTAIDGIYLFQAHAMPVAYIDIARKVLG